MSIFYAPGGPDSPCGQRAGRPVRHPEDILLDSRVNLFNQPDSERGHPLPPDKLLVKLLQLELHPAEVGLPPGLQLAHSLPVSLMGDTSGFRSLTQFFSVDF